MHTIEDVDYIRIKLRNGGYKLTKQRFQIIDAINKNRKHMSIDEIYSKVKRRNIGLSTVYRNVIILEKVGILKSINMCSINYYEIESTAKHKVHVHAQCIKCNKLIDIDESKMIVDWESVVNNTEKNYSITVDSVSIMLSSICSKCSIEKDSDKAI
ncbi:Fur family transcriptional regulator [Clostridium sp.]|jgi:Fe2+ or Zn2+ uptake regulation protein|uniref:Fur family transcriptional regulator n=1 Tax=Clostridium sp. TaxID=1506 RepID=UPI002588F63B|nr:Fur family transcriptional regulator [Clostridium sp.]MDF2503750.1 Fur family transcriptional regulator [Clostridium sp.]